MLKANEGKCKRTPVIASHAVDAATSVFCFFVGKFVSLNVVKWVTLFVYRFKEHRKNHVLQTLIVHRRVILSNLCQNPS